MTDREADPSFERLDTLLADLAGTDTEVTVYFDGQSVTGQVKAVNHYVVQVWSWCRVYIAKHAISAVVVP